MRVLIVEDQERMADTLARGLRNHTMAVDVAYDGIDGLEKARTNPYDVIVLDRDLPGLHGDLLCRLLRSEDNPARVIMCTAASTTADLVTGLDLGADDYLSKPFELAELLARVRALGRRGPQVSPTVLTWADLELDPARITVKRNGRHLMMTPREHAVLEVLMRAQGEVVSAEALFERAWDDRADPFTASVRVIMSRLRAKIGEPPLIETVVTRGYRMVDPAS